jgi:hypothetical protein
VTRGNKVLVGVGFALMTASIVTAGVFTQLLDHSRVLVVTMAEGVTQDDRVSLREACGGLPGVEVVPDRGDPNPEIQRAFPVRFDITDATPREEAAITTCVQQVQDREGTVRGFLVEGDR